MASLSYTRINQVINEVVFDGRYRLSPIYLDLEEDLIKELARRLGISEDKVPENIALATSRTLRWADYSPYAWHLSELEAWSSLGRPEAPPFTALLCTLSLAADRMRQEGHYSAHNYYERLFEVLSITNESQKNRVRASGASTLVFWRALNEWLAENDFEYGRPTAKRVNHWEYVSYALSQALVREADRKRFHNMFIEFGLAPNEQLTEPEIILYLHEWMRGSSASNWLKKLWAVPDLRPRVASAAKTELENWNGAELSSEASLVTRRTLTWAASLVTFPRRELRLFLATANGETASLRHLSVEEPASPAALQAFANCKEGLWLSSIPSGDFSVLEPIQKISLSALLLASFELGEADSNIKLRHVARPIVPLVKLDTGAYYREVSRISMLRPHMVLCHEHWRQRVSAHLKLYARPGYKEIDAGSVPGLPEDWVLFTGVEIVRASESNDQNIQVLVPLSEGAALEMAGGLKLAQNLWHSRALPEITAAAERGPLTIQLRENTFSESINVVAQTRSGGSACQLILDDVPLPPDGNFTVVLVQAGKDKSECALSLRSAESPRRLNSSGNVEQVYGIHPVVPRSADSLVPRSSAPKGALILRGMIAEAANTDVSAVSVPNHAVLQHCISGETEEGGEATPSYAMQRVQGLSETCVLRGHHYWICQSFEKGDEVRDAKWMTCKDCNNAVLTRNRGVVRRRQPVRLQPGQRPTSGSQVQMPARKGSKIEPGIIFDALCYLGSGSWQKLQDLASEEAETPWFPRRFSAALIDLGHIDGILDQSMRRPVSWVCSPPAFVVTDDGKGFIAGYRSCKFIRSISDALGDVGTQLEEIQQESAPPAIICSGIEIEKARKQLARITDAHGRHIAVVHSPARAIATFAPRLPSITEVLPEIHIEDTRDLEWFDPKTVRWRPATALEQPGAYRTSFAGRRYVYKSPHGAVKEGGYEAVKILSARDVGLRLHGYSASTRTFDCAIGCEPPGLFRRALVACSGRLPQVSNGRIQYHNVEPAIAALILDKLYN